jgi:hypothetical protein
MVVRVLFDLGTMLKSEAVVKKQEPNLKIQTGGWIVDNKTFNSAGLPMVYPNRRYDYSLSLTAIVCIL